MRTLSLLLLAVFTAPIVGHAAEEGSGYQFGADLAFWSLVTFIGFVVVIKKLGWEGFVSGLKERERKENEAIARAEDKNRAAQQELIDRKGQLEAIDETTGEFLEEARRDALRTRKDIVDSATNEAETLKNRALREIERTRSQSLKELFDTMSMRVIERTEEQLRSTLTESDQQRLMDESLAEFTTSSTK